MPNIIQNGNFERDLLRYWEVFPEYMTESSDPIIRTQESPAASRGQSLYIEVARWFRIEQSFPWVVYAGESQLHLSFRGEAADFYVIIHYEDGTTDSSHFYGHWPSTWENEQVTVTIGKGIVRLEFQFLGAWSFYLDDISLDGSSISPFVPWRPRMRKIPEELYDYDLRFSHTPLLGRVEGIERELKRISTLLSRQQHPDVDKNIDEAIAKYEQKEDIHF